MNYGYKYAKIFRDEIRPELSDEGKEWVDRTMRGLQERMEQAYQDGTLDEMDPEAFKDFAMDIHSDVYVENGFHKLPGEDIWTVLKRLTKERKDLLLAVPEMLEVAPWVVTSGEAQNLEGIYHDLKQREEEKGDGEGAPPLHILLRAMPPMPLY